MPGRSDVVDRAPPHTGSGEGGGGGGWAWLVTAGGRIEAELVRGLLETVGIVPVWLDTRDPSPSAWLFPFGDQNAPVRVYVPASLLESARLELLETGFALPEIAEPERAPARRGPPLVLIVVACIILGIFVWATLRASVV